MAGRDFHDKPYDPVTRSKLQVIELYVQEWLPVFLSQADPRYKDLHIFDFFSGPGADSGGCPGIPLRILSVLSAYHDQRLAGWNAVSKTVHLLDIDPDKTKILAEKVNDEGLDVADVSVDIQSIAFKDALAEFESLLRNRDTAKLLLIDQFGVDEVSDEIFRDLIRFPVADFIFFLSSSTLHRFRDLPAIKQKIDRPEDSYHVHRAAVEYYRKLVPGDQSFFLAPFSLKKGSNIYGLVFGSKHPLGIHKFLEIAWKTDSIAGEANFDIERERIDNDELLLDLEVMRPNKVRVFESELENAIRSGLLLDEADIVRYCIEAGMTCRHAEPVLSELKKQRVVQCNFRVPNIKGLKNPRSLRLSY